MVLARSCAPCADACLSCSSSASGTWSVSRAIPRRELHWPRLDDDSPASGALLFPSPSGDYAAVSRAGGHPRMAGLRSLAGG